MIIPVLGLLAALSPVLAGGRLGRYAELRLRSSWVLFLALLTQVAIIEVVPGAARGLLSAVHVATYVAAGWFVWRNRQVPGLWLLALGAASNGVTIAVNGGTLPASAGALAGAGIQQDQGEFLNSTTLAHPHLGFLGDVLFVPAGWPLANVFSVGDVLILLGRLWGAHRVCGSRLVPPVAGRPANLPRPAGAAPAAGHACEGAAR